ncbi:NAD(P)-dependent dehydrogenase (short-subunit alcohol dehydrogenase family) [Crossiella equi]|uniref:NAD(P)-dependent dehydrogenase (Short-subunit alcohol dehydrogenase family) n=1 Tax=Crossiella equi TaxID=130796 RepID=A0ABS5ANW5_9PSEU|nr:SDR family NAD(P)-dependent oxidoreductase [Crossiella equi]MBP2477385.1 NAD(P)-dependent dehydrogenase (short-subunit alcohol dehydrogenase family) [Crossiella equi]
MRDFHGRVAVVTGAGSGIGRSLALELAKRGSRLALSDVDGYGLKETVRQVERLGARAKGYELDVANRRAVLAHAEEVVEDFGRVELVVNNAGVTATASFTETDLTDFDWVMDIDFGGVLNGTKAFLPHLIASGDGYLVNVSSVFGLFTVPRQTSYHAAKYAVRGFTESLRQELRLEGHPVGVSCVHPGGIKTNIVNNARHATPERGKELSTSFDRLARTTPGAAARTILRGVQRNQARILIGPDAHVLNLLQAVLGSRFQWVTERVTKRAMY